ncbi:MAG: hypothetical protein M3173_00385 [Chloroflexota bacterium]|nr:hypothetical protein [Chloroflexota bacterium]
MGRENKGFSAEEAAGFLSVPDSLALVREERDGDDRLVREYRSTAGALPCVEFAAAAAAWAGALADQEGPCTL